MKNHVQLKNILLGGAAVAMFVVPSFAQEQQVETVTVTGIRASLQSAQSIKQNSDQVVDSITAVDIGALPDRSVAEALQRVPGVQITRTDANRDPVRWAGYGNGVFIRGLSWVSALTNGLATFGAENGRTLSFADVSSDLMSGVDVYKNPSAKMIEGGVGGVVDLRTRKPFDQDGFTLAGSADFSYGDLNEHIAPSANILVSDRWNTKVGEVGALLSFDYQDLRAGTNVFSLGVYDGNFCGTSAGGYTSRASYSAACPSGQNAVQIPDGDALSYRHMDWKQPRVAIYGAVQWRPSEKVEITATALWSKAEPQSVEHVVTWGLPDGSSNLQGYKFDSAGSFISGSVANAENIWGGQDTRYGARHHISGQYALDLKYTPTDRLTITANVSYLDSRATMYDMTMYTKQVSNKWQNGTFDADSIIYPSAPVVNVSWNASVGHPVIGYSGDVGAMATKTNYVWGAAMDHLENNYAHNYTARGDLTYQFEGQGAFGLIKSVDFGFRADLREATTRQSNWNWVGMNFQTWYVWAGLSDTAIRSTIGNIATSGNSTAQNATELYKMPEFFGMNLPAMWFPKSSFMYGGEHNVWNTIKTTGDAWRAAGTWVGVWQPLVTNYYGAPYNCEKVTAYYCNAIYANTTPSSTSQSGGVNSPSENTYAGYFQANFSHDTFLGAEVPVDGNIGVRIVATESASGPGYFLYPSISDCGSAATPDPICVGTDKGNAYTFVGNGGGSMNAKAASVAHDYVDILPSFNFRAHLSDTLQARFAFSQQIVRPDFSFTQNYTSLAYNFGTAPDQYAFRAGDGLVGTGGNPDLKPLHANNFDASIEWFFAPTGSLSFALFHKDISNYFMTTTVPTTYTRNGVTQTFAVQRYANGKKGKVEGFELAYQQFYDSLPGAWSGIGVQANYTKIYNTGGSNASYNISDSNAVALALNETLPMEGMSHDSYNFALLYAKYNIDARLAWNWRSGFLMTTSAANLNQPVWQGNYGQLDGSIIYSFLDHYKIGLQVNNLTKQMTTLYVGGAAYHPKYEWVDADRKISLVLRAHW